MNHETIINAASSQLATAIAEAERTGSALTVAQGRVSAIEQRIAEKASQRAAIVARRARGEHRDDDGASLELIAVDTETLRQLLADAQAAVSIVKQPAEQAQRQVSMARHALQQAEAEVSLAGLIDHASRLDALMLATVGQIGEVCQRLDRRTPPWGASAELFQALRKIALQRREIF
jgi:hypothetical protein